MNPISPPNATQGNESKSQISRNLKPGEDPLRDFKIQLTQRIDEKLEYPRSLIALRIQGSTTVKITISRSGQVESAQIAQSSGHIELDELALKAVLSAQPYPQPPGFAPSLTLRLPIEFRLPRPPK